MTTPTFGYHRFSNVVARANYGTDLQVVPGATIYVTETATDSEATIYSDSGLVLPIPGALITSDQWGFYDYYLPLDYPVTETISAPWGILAVIPNICQNTGILGSQTPVIGEIVSGSGTDFVLANTPVVGSVALYNGAARLRPGALPADYTISGTNITMNYSLSTGALLADYRY